MRLILDIKLRGIEDPIIWRKMAVPTILTFHELHLMIQAAMGWEHQHLYSFTEHPESRYFMIVSPYAEEFGADATKISASNILRFVTQKGVETRFRIFTQFKARKVYCG